MTREAPRRRAPSAQVLPDESDARVRVDGGSPPVHRIALVLPLPPAMNSYKTKHWATQRKEKNEYRRKCWNAAVEQHRPSLDPPAHVTARAWFMLHNLRDEDKLTGSLEYVMDTLGAMNGGPRAWRDQTTHWPNPGWGYYRDDDPKHLTVEKPVQVIDRKDPCLVLLLTSEGA